MSEHNNQPYVGLGKKLKLLRIEARESIMEVSGAVEIDSEKLVEIESGTVLPSEDILLLLISHFEMEDDDAVSLWELAGYSEEPKKAKPDNTPQPAFYVVPTDNRILYSDKTDVSINDAGVVLNFKQGNDEQSVARVGMSKQQALATMELLQTALQAKPHHQKLLPKPKQKTTTDESQ